MSRSLRLAVLSAFVVLAVAGFLVARPDSEPPPPSTTTPATATTDRFTNEKPPPPPVPVVRVRDGSPLGGVRRIAARSGETIRFRIASDVPTEVHVHGYDLTRRVPGGGTASFAFQASIEGVFEVELHPQHEVVARLVVTP